MKNNNWKLVWDAFDDWKIDLYGGMDPDSNNDLDTQLTRIGGFRSKDLLQRPDPIASYPKDIKVGVAYKNGNKGDRNMDNEDEGNEEQNQPNGEPSPRWRRLEQQSPKWTLHYLINKLTILML